MKQLVIATGNKGKLEEFRRLLKPYGIQVLSMGDAAPTLKVEETGSTFAENAYLKADALHKATGLAALADDSGLCVDALQGAPGVYSARYGGDAYSGDGDRNRLLLEQLRDVPLEQRTARFTAHITYITSQGTVVDFEESCEGTIGFAPAGARGFGYDPLFYVGEKSFAELSHTEKDKLSHRGKAVRKFMEYMKEQNYADK